MSKIIRVRWFLDSNMIDIPKDDEKLLDECEIKTSDLLEKVDSM